MTSKIMKILYKGLQALKRRPELYIVSLVALVVIFMLFTNFKDNDRTVLLSSKVTKKHTSPFQPLEPIPTVPFITIPKDPPLHRKPPILLLTYMRSGSTFTADVIQQSPDVFYIYEPFKAFTDQYYYTQSQICSFTDKGCRLPKTKFEDASYVVRNILNLFLCDFQHVDRNVLRIMTSRKMSSTQAHFADCIQGYNTTKIVEFCIKKMQDICTGKNVFIKTIRLTMEVVALLLDLIPDLKVIHLIRDPRGVMFSRHRGHVVNDTNFKVSAKSTCSRILKDIMRSYQLKMKYPHRIKTQLYEYLAEKPLESLYDLHNFTNTTVVSSMKQYIHNHTMTGENLWGYYSTTRGNSTMASIAWRMRMKWKDVRAVDNECQMLYEHVGFIPFSDKSQLTNLSFKTRKKESPLFEKF